MSWIQTAKIGDKVVCVDDAPRPGRFWAPGRKPVAGGIYTIAAIFVDETGKDPGETLFEFSEIGRFHNKHGGRLGYRPARFRPVTTRKIDISWAHDILKKASKPVEETA